jgi:hypothetical protein
MAQTTIFTCDICKQSKSQGDLAKITIKTDGIHIKGLSPYNNLVIDVCSSCLKKKGFVVEYKKEEEEQAAMQNKQTLEDKIYDFLSDMGVVFQE